MIARALAAALLAGVATLSAAAEPAKPAIEFARIQDECVSTPAVPFGPGERWSSCRLTRAGFVGTIGLLDFYYATYCLVSRGERCDRAALMVFANRAYRPEATLQFHRVDPAGTRYEHAMMVGTADAHAIATTARLPGQPVERQFRAWAGDRWQPVDAAAWRATLAADLPSRLPEGLRAQLPREVMPEPERMALLVPLRRARDGSAAGVAEVSVTLDGARFAVGDVHAPKASR